MSVNLTIVCNFIGQLATITQRSAFAVSKVFHLIAENSFQWTDIFFWFTIVVYFFFFFFLTKRFSHAEVFTPSTGGHPNIVKARVTLCEVYFVIKFDCFCIY